MKFRILLSALIIFAVSATAFAATRAALSSQATLAASTFSTGTADLQISSSPTNSGGTFHDGSIAGFTGKVLPGQTTSKLFWLKNNSTDVDFTIAAQSASVSGEISPGDITIGFTPVSDDGLTNTGSIVSHTLAVWNSADNLGTTLTHGGGKQRYRMDVTLSSGVTTSGSVTFDFIFTGTQTP